MKYIFLDVDGVLNCENTTQRCQGWTGIDPMLVENLKHIIDQTGAQIILTSTWKYYWKPADTPGMDEIGKYLNDMLADAGLTIVGYTEDHGENRGQGILNYLMDHPAEAWVVLDDIFFPDFEACGISNHLVLTTSDYDGYGGCDGLTKELAIQAVHIINEQLRE